LLVVPVKVEPARQQIGSARQAGHVVKRDRLASQHFRPHGLGQHNRLGAPADRRARDRIVGVRTEARPENRSQRA
jgi:hypothetical protein